MYSGSSCSMAQFVGVIDDAAGLILDDLIPLHDAFDRGFAVHDVFVHLQRDAGERDAAVLDDCCLEGCSCKVKGTAVGLRKAAIRWDPAGHR